MQHTHDTTYMETTHLKHLTCFYTTHIPHLPQKPHVSHRAHMTHRRPIHTYPTQTTNKPHTHTHLHHIKPQVYHTLTILNMYTSLISTVHYTQHKYTTYTHSYTTHTVHIHKSNSSHFSNSDIQLRLINERCLLGCHVFIFFCAYRSFEKLTVYHSKSTLSGVFTRRKYTNSKR